MKLRLLRRLGRTSWVLSVENDQICFAGALGKFCSPIYRTPEGTQEKNDEYIMMWRGGAWLFSAYEDARRRSRISRSTISSPEAAIAIGSKPPTQMVATETGMSAFG